MKLYIFGKNGMLGNTFFLYFSKIYDTIGFDRKDFNVLTQDWDGLKQLLISNNFQAGDIVLNCIGIIPQKKSPEDEYTIVNSRFPHELSRITRNLQGILIHISTNCVFSHSFNPYSEEDSPVSDDIYGQTKYEGEPLESTIIRTSIIGEEKKTCVSLLSWALSSREPIKGYEDHFWNGVTCLQLAKVVHNMIETNFFWKGVRHIHSNETISKYELLKLIFTIYNHTTTILPITTGNSSTKLLSSIYSPILEIPPLSQQILEQKLFFKKETLEKLAKAFQNSLERNDKFMVIRKWKDLVTR